MKWCFPRGKLLAIVVILSIVGPAHYFLHVYKPQGSVFLGYSDDAMMLALMRSPASGFDDPWSFDGGKVWHNPLIGTVYLFVILGLVPLSLSLDVFAAFFFFKLLFTFFYYIVVYNVITELIKNKNQQRIAFVVFMLAAGLGGILYASSVMAFGQSDYIPVIGYAFTREFDELAATAHSLTHTFRLYYLVGETLGYLGLLFFMRNRKLQAGVFLGLVFLVYPMYGITFSLVVLLYSIAKNCSSFVPLVRKTAIDVLPVYALAAVFLLPWIIPSFERPYYYNALRLNYEALPLLNIIISFFFAGVFVLYYLYKKPVGLFKNPAFVTLFAVSLVSFILKGLQFTADTSTLFKGWLLASGLYGLVNGAAKYSVFIEFLVLLLTFALAISIFAEKFSPKVKFLLLWVVIFSVVSGVDPSHLGRSVNTVRFAPSLILPISVLSSYGLLMFSKNPRLRSLNISPKLLLAAIIFLSLPSVIGYNVWLQKSQPFFTEDEYGAMRFLENQSRGAVLSHVRYGAYIPYYTGKHAFIFSGREETFSSDPESELLFRVNRDHDAFYNKSTTAETRGEILDRYNITYVLIGSQDKPIDIPASFRKIRIGETDVYARAYS